jgi:phosphoribosyl 1,2-cyclic phosphodiesterase
MKMTLDIIATGSSGNSYILTASDGEIFLIELGVQERFIKQAIDFQISSVVAAYASHVHQDHIKSLERFLSMGVKILAPYRDNVLKGEYGRYKAICFPLVHDVDCYGLYLEHPEMGNMVYISDSSYCPVDFSKQKLNHILIEANWQDDMVDFEAPNFEHKIRHHMSLQTCKDFVKHNASNELHNVVLIHWSESTIDLDHAVEEIKSVCDVDVNVIIAEPGLEIKLNKEWLDD